MQLQQLHEIFHPLHHTAHAPASTHVQPDTQQHEPAHAHTHETHAQNAQAGGLSFESVGHSRIFLPFIYMFILINNDGCLIGLENSGLSNSVVIDDMVVGDSVIIDGKRVMLLDEDDFPDYANLPPYRPPSSQNVSAISTSTTATSTTSTSTSTESSLEPIAETVSVNTTTPDVITPPIPATTTTQDEPIINVPITPTTTTTTTTTTEQEIDLTQSPPAHAHVALPDPAQEFAPEKATQDSSFGNTDDDEIPEEIEIDGKVQVNNNNATTEEDADIPEIIETEELQN